MIRRRTVPGMTLVAPCVAAVILMPGMTAMVVTALSCLACLNGRCRRMSVVVSFSSLALPHGPLIGRVRTMCRSIRRRRADMFGMNSVIAVVVGRHLPVAIRRGMLVMTGMSRCIGFPQAGLLMLMRMLMLMLMRSMADPVMRSCGHPAFIHGGIHVHRRMPMRGRFTGILRMVCSASCVLHAVILIRRHSMRRLLTIRILPGKMFMGRHAR